MLVAAFRKEQTSLPVDILFSVYLSGILHLFSPVSIKRLFDLACLHIIFSLSCSPTRVMAFLQGVILAVCVPRVRAEREVRQG